MSAPPRVDTRTFTASERTAMAAEIRPYLAYHLQKAAEERYDPVLAVEELTGITASELKHVVLSHVCLSRATARFCDALPAAVHAASSLSPPARVVSRVVRGQVDWPATIRLRTTGGGDTGLFAVRPTGREPGLAEHRTLAWTLQQLESRAQKALQGSGRDDPSEWQRTIATVARTVQRARAAEQLRAVEPRRPDQRALTRLSTMRPRFYRVELAAVAGMLLRAESADPDELSSILCERFFVPHQTWMLYELLVALRFERAFRDHVGPALRRRLLRDLKRRPYAEFRLACGDTVALYRGGWPHGAEQSARERTGARHELSVDPAKPDLVVVRSGAKPDCVVVELKASRKDATLAAGIDQLLRYLSDQPDLFARRPSGWLVAPWDNPAFKDREPASSEPLWIATVDVATTEAVTRMTG